MESILILAGVLAILLVVFYLSRNTSDYEDPEVKGYIEIGQSAKYNEKIKINNETIHSPYSGGLGCAPAPPKEFGEESGCKISKVTGKPFQRIGK